MRSVRLTLVLAVALTTIPAAAASAVAQAAPASLTLAASPSEITAGNTPQLVGQVTRDGASTSGVRVELYEKRYGEITYRLVGETTSGDDGKYQFTVQPLIQSAYVVRDDRTSSVAVVVFVHTRLVLDWPRPDERRGNPWHIGGNLLPRLGSVPVGVGVFVGGTYRFLGQGVTDDGGQFSIAVSLPPGEVTLVAYTSARPRDLPK